jgi:hypothetical protein
VEADGGGCAEASGVKEACGEDFGGDDPTGTFAVDVGDSARAERDATEYAAPLDSNSDSVHLTLLKFPVIIRAIGGQWLCGGFVIMALIA